LNQSGGPPLEDPESQPPYAHRLISRRVSLFTRGPRYTFLGLEQSETLQMMKRFAPQGHGGTVRIPMYIGTALEMTHGALLECVGLFGRTG